MKELPQHAVAKVSGPSWEPLRKQFLEIGQVLLEASPDAQAELLSQYVKFTTSAAPNDPAYAVVWLKSSKRLIVGLALPEAYEAEGLGAAMPKITYRGLTKYFAVEAGDMAPRGLAAWAGMAYRNVVAATVPPSAATPEADRCRRASKKTPVAGLPDSAGREAA
jgi:hypothetical protein